MKDSFIIWKNVTFSTSEGCQTHSPREPATMFSHVAGAAPAATVTVAPVAPAHPGVPGRA